MASFIIRNISYEDVPAVLALPKSEGREMGMESELLSWMKVDPCGIFVAVNTQNGEIAGCCSGMALSDYHGYIGMYVVGRQFRGLGLGRILWDAAISRLGDRNISLSSVEKMFPCYRDKAGFGVMADWTVDLYSIATPSMPSKPITTTFPTPYTIKIDPKGPFVQYVLDYDASIHYYDRSDITKATVNELGTITLLAVKPSLDGCIRVSGYACMKKTLQGHWLMAPMYADDYDSAYSLMYGLLQNLTPEQRCEGLVAKLISSNYQASKLFLQFGMKKSQYQLRRLFTKEVFSIPESKIFALQSSVFCTE